MRSLVDPSIARALALAPFQRVLARCRDDAGRKTLIVEAHLAGALTTGEAELLIGAMLLESA